MKKNIPHIIRHYKRDMTLVSVREKLFFGQTLNIKKPRQA